MKLPLVIVAEDKTIEFYRNTDELQKGLESYDVDNKVYTAYDADGVLYDLLVENKQNEPKGFFTINTSYGKINITPTNKLTNESKLKEILLANLAIANIPVSEIDTIDLLIDKLFSYQGYTLS